MHSLLAASILLASQDPAPASASPAVRWLNCSVLETPQGQVIVDRLAYVFFDAGSAVITPQAAQMLDSFVEQYNQPVPSPICPVTIGGNADRVKFSEGCRG